jgi:hypothetical protein
MFGDVLLVQVQRRGDDGWLAWISYTSAPVTGSVDTLAVHVTPADIVMPGRSAQSPEKSAPST